MCGCKKRKQNVNTTQANIDAAKKHLDDVRSKTTPPKQS